MSMTPHATVKPWRKTIRGEKRATTVNERRTRTRNAPEARDLDALTEHLIAQTDRQMAAIAARREARLERWTR